MPFPGDLVEPLHILDGLLEFVESEPIRARPGVIALDDPVEGLCKLK